MRVVLGVALVLVCSLADVDCGPSACTQQSCPLDQVCNKDGRCVAPAPVPPPAAEGEGAGGGGCGGGGPAGGGEGEGEGGGNNGDLTSLHGASLYAVEFGTGSIVDVAFDAPGQTQYLGRLFANGAALGNDGALVYIVGGHLRQYDGDPNDRSGDTELDVNTACASASIRQLVVASAADYVYECGGQYFVRATPVTVASQNFVLALNDAFLLTTDFNTLAVDSINSGQTTTVNATGSISFVDAGRIAPDGFFAAGPTATGGYEILDVTTSATAHTVGTTPPPPSECDPNAGGFPSPVISADGQSVFALCTQQQQLGGNVEVVQLSVSGSAIAIYTSNATQPVPLDDNAFLFSGGSYAF